MKLLVTICARGGSKGIPGKNIKPLNGVPLLHYTLNLAFNLIENYNADIQLSTDSKEIISCANKLGYFTDYVRPKELADDKSGKLEAIKHAKEYAENFNQIKYDYILDLDATSPLRTENDIEKALNMLHNKKDALNIFSVNHSSRSPYFNMVEDDKNGFVKVIKKHKDSFVTRQSVPKTYDMNASFYIFKASFFDKGYKVSTTPYSMAYIMDHICFDLDHPIDFTIMELMLKHNLLEFTI